MPILRNKKDARIKEMVNPTIFEVAKLAGVSISTVSRCLNEPNKVGKKTLTRVRKVIEEINFSPNLLAQSFCRGKTNIVMVVVQEIGNPFFSRDSRGNPIRTRWTVLLGVDRISIGSGREQ